jgi:hypothetical protein
MHRFDEETEGEPTGKRKSAREDITIYLKKTERDGVDWIHLAGVKISAGIF